MRLTISTDNTLRRDNGLEFTLTLLVENYLPQDELGCHFVSELETPSNGRREWKCSHDAQELRRRVLRRTFQKRTIRRSDVAMCHRIFRLTCRSWLDLDYNARSSKGLEETRCTKEHTKVKAVRKRFSRSSWAQILEEHRSWCKLARGFLA